MAKKTTSKKVAAKKESVSKTAAKKTTAAKKSAAKTNSKSVAKSAEAKPKKAPAVKTVRNPYTASFMKKQMQLLKDERDNLIDSMNGVQREQLRQHDTGAEASGQGDHLADAGNDAYERDYALSLLSKEQGDLREIDAAIARCKLGAYGICEGSGEVIPQMRLEARPAARYTVAFQTELEKSGKYGTKGLGKSMRIIGAEDVAIESMEESVDI